MSDNRTPVSMSMDELMRTFQGVSSVFAPVCSRGVGSRSSVGSGRGMPV